MIYLGIGWDGGQVAVKVLRPELAGGGSHAITALAASGTAVTAIDSVQTQASQQFVVLRLPSG